MLQGAISKISAVKLAHPEGGGAEAPWNEYFADKSPEWNILPMDIPLVRI
jgi:hypothetical protein